MCRNIRTLFNFQPPATDDEIRAASLQFVRKLSGTNKPSRANEQAFSRAVEDVTAAALRADRPWLAAAWRPVAPVRACGRQTGQPLATDQAGLAATEGEAPPEEPPGADGIGLCGIAHCLFLLVWSGTTNRRRGPQQAHPWMRGAELPAQSRMRSAVSTGQPRSSRRAARWMSTSPRSLSTIAWGSGYPAAISCWSRQLRTLR